MIINKILSISIEIFYCNKPDKQNVGVLPK